MGKYEELRSAFGSQKDNENAVSMENYRKNQFDFYGLATPQRKALYKEFIKSEKKSKSIDWELLDCCYADNHREFQYLVYDYLLSCRTALFLTSHIKKEIL